MKVKYDDKNLALAKVIKKAATDAGLWQGKFTQGAVNAYDYWYWARRGDYGPAPSSAGRGLVWHDRPDSPEKFGMTREQFESARILIYG